MSASAGVKPVYEFDESFQLKIAALAARDPGFHQRVAGLLNPDHFENEAHAFLVAESCVYYATYKKTPHATIWVKILKDRFAEPRFREELKDPIKKAFKEVLTADISDREYVVEEVVKFARHQALGSAIIDSVDLLEKRDFDEIGLKVKRALEVGAGHDVTGYDYFDALKDRTERRKAMAAGTITHNGITTGISKIDAHLYHRGWGRKELSIIMGAAKSGKTMALVDFMKNAAFAGYKVLYVSLEVSAEIISDRLDANIANVMMSELGTKALEVADKIKAAEATIKGNMRVHAFPTGTLKPSALRRLMSHYAAEGLVFDMVVVDYADIMAAERARDEMRAESASIITDLRAIAVEEDIAVLTATQTNRDGAKATLAKMTDVAEDFNKVRIADLVISINSSEEERAMNEARLYFAASRNQAGNFTLRIKQDLERAKFVRKVIAKE